MKRICLFYSQTTEKFYVNEKGEKLSETVPEENITDKIEQALALVKKKYGHRAIELLVDVPEEKRYTKKGKDWAEIYIKDTKISLG